MSFENKKGRLMSGEMTIRAIRDYFYSFRPSNIVTGDTIYILFFLLILPMIYTMDPFDEVSSFDGMRICMTACGVVPVVLALIGARINPLPFSKIVYLCPMNDRQRREYTVAMFWVRILFPCLLFVVCRIVFWVVSPIHLFYLVTDLMLFLAILGTGMTRSSTNFYGLNSTAGERAYGERSSLAAESVSELRYTKKTPINDAANKGLASMLIGYFTWFFVTLFGADEQLYGLWTAMVLLLADQMYMTYKMYSKLNDYIQYASSYEGE